MTLRVYKSTQAFPPEERYGLRSQIRRSSISIGANIAEGAGKITRPDFARFLQIAMGSASELEYELLLARDLGYLDNDCYSELATQVIDVKRMLSGFVQYLYGSRTGTEG
jgi:four helix bundle protein